MRAQDLDLLVRCLRANRRTEGRVLERLARRGVLPAAATTDIDVRVLLGLLYQLVRFTQPRTIVQVGTFVGASAAAMALALADNGLGRLFTIDPEPPQYFNVDQPVAIARRALHAARLADRVHFVRGYSTVPADSGRMALPVRRRWCLMRVVPADYDVLVVDGDHTYDGCYRDLVYGSTRLSPTGPRLIVVHDYFSIADVRRAVRAWRRAWRDSALRVVPSPCGIAILSV